MRVYSTYAHETCVYTDPVCLGFDKGPVYGSEAHQCSLHDHRHSTLRHFLWLGLTLSFSVYLCLSPSVAVRFATAELHARLSCVEAGRIVEAAQGPCCGRHSADLLWTALLRADMPPAAGCLRAEAGVCGSFVTRGQAVLPKAQRRGV